MMFSLGRPILRLLHSRSIPGGIRMLIRQPLRRAMFGNGVMITARGISVECHDDNHCEYVFALRMPQPALDHCAALLKEGSVFVDVGANCGLFSLVASTIVGPSGKVIAIEPNPVMVDRLKANIATNAAQVTVVPAAVGERDGTATLNVHDDGLGLSNLRDSGSDKATRKVNVPVTTLAGVAATHAPKGIDLMKVDVEGFEDRVLVPFFETAPKELWPKQIYLEIIFAKHWQSDLLGRLRSLGYETVWQSDSDMHLRLNATSTAAAQVTTEGQVQA